MRRAPEIVVISGKSLVQWPLDCPECEAPMELRTFGGYLKYFCSILGCTGIHGAHRSGKPLGIPAKANVRKARSSAHVAFDRIWEHKKMTRSQAYVWLSKAMGTQEAHIGNFDIEQCRKVVAAVKAEFPDLFPFSDDVP